MDGADAPRGDHRPSGDLVHRGRRRHLSILDGSATSLEAENRGSGLTLLLPHSWSLEAYLTVFQGGVITHALLVSFVLTACGTVLSLLATISLAYALSRPVFAGRTVLWLVILTLIFTPGIIPTLPDGQAARPAELLRLARTADLMNGFNLVVMRQFFMNIPEELIDSAKIDGASDFKILFRVVLPLSKAVHRGGRPVLRRGVLELLLPGAALPERQQSMWPLQLVCGCTSMQGASLPGFGDRQFGANPPPSQCASRWQSSSSRRCPILLVYPFLQRYMSVRRTHRRDQGLSFPSEPSPSAVAAFLSAATPGGDPSPGSGTQAGP